MPVFRTALSRTQARCLWVTFFGLFAVPCFVVGKEISFDRDIRPILSDNCFHCHGPDDVDREEELRLDIPDGPLGALTPRNDYHIIKPGEPEESELWFRITSEFDLPLRFERVSILTRMVGIHHQICFPY